MNTYWLDPEPGVSRWAWANKIAATVDTAFLERAVAAVSRMANLWRRICDDNEELRVDRPKDKAHLFALLKRESVARRALRILETNTGHQTSERKKVLSDVSSDNVYLDTLLSLECLYLCKAGWVYNGTACKWIDPINKQLKTHYAAVKHQREKDYRRR